MYEQLEQYSAFSLDICYYYSHRRQIHGDIVSTATRLSSKFHIEEKTLPVR